ncbi:hypothetical protein KQI61_05755 [Anaerocolumna aminovalerica]|uniref:hypothetical protein n=1 Tax=Anaerocolumna aminovalerica TaxID=1527 RepID=UPI001C0F067B|nr:hypothetical protein [Anaerocolumna aminovalerica]MBU5331695.1 hypothetical protein [Anaerocolumna aminovalerica]
MSEEMQKMINEVPEECLITGLRRCDSYIFDEGIVYLPEPAYDAYTLPEYDRKNKAFYRTKIDMDDDFRREIEHLCDLNELAAHPRLNEILDYYKITEEEYQSAFDNYFN